MAAVTAEEPLARRLELTLRPDPERTVLRPFDLATAADRGDGHDGRLNRVLAQVRAIDEAHLDLALRFTDQRLDGRHRDAPATLRRNALAAAELVPGVRDLDDRRQLLFGGYVTQEYAFEAAALFNPSVMLHPRQDKVPEGSVRLITSLRGIGEGHISSITFRALLWDGGEQLKLEEHSKIAVSPKIEEHPDGGAQITFTDSRHASESVLFPVLPSQARGLEDMRLVRLVEPDDSIRYLGSYTAVGTDGSQLQIMEGHDFDCFDLWPITGEIAGSKGGAIFPRRVDDKYLMVSRQDGESLWLAESDDLVAWTVRQQIMTARYAWEFAQIGNCGSPIELDEGWLLLTHGVGTIRNYTIGACLLDRDDPAKVLKRLPRPLLRPEEAGRDGYVSNVVYSCGGVVKDGTLLLPYGAADSYTGFAIVDVQRLLAAME
ncbi:glycosidase [Sphingomonas bacterium]|uniref:glycoside hydrolase family 130 protein n=1 Tax=Sphingomonas bacterium TaxID=1895847 RepID=UPI0020C6A19A|nr:glycosidase [Sphingomonas bacterium]